MSGAAGHAHARGQGFISGIFKGTPSNSSQQFDFVLSFEIAKENSPGFLSWANSGPMTFVLLKDGTDRNLFNKKIEKLINSKVEV
jgi:hypothetical protein